MHPSADRAQATKLGTNSLWLHHSFLSSFSSSSSFLYIQQQGVLLALYPRLRRDAGRSVFQNPLPDWQSTRLRLAMICKMWLSYRRCATSLIQCIQLVDVIKETIHSDWLLSILMLHWILWPTGLMLGYLDIHSNRTYFLKKVETKVECSFITVTQNLPASPSCPRYPAVSPWPNHHVLISHSTWDVYDHLSLEHILHYIYLLFSTRPVVRHNWISKLVCGVNNTILSI